MNKLLKNALEKSVKKIARNPEAISFSLLTSKLTCPKLVIKPEAFSNMMRGILNGMFVTFKEVIMYDLKI